jgi:hypothetical protein
MFVSDSRYLRAAFSTLALVVCLGVSSRSDTSLGTAESFVRLAYDELMGQELGVSVTLSPLVQHNPLEWDRLSQVLVRFDAPRAGGPRSTDMPTLQVSLGIDVDGNLLRARAKGSYVKTSELDSIVQFARERANSSDASLLAELERRGARFVGNVSEFEAHARLSRLEPFVGRIVKSESSFEVRVPHMQSNGKDVFSFEWRVVLDTEPMPGRSLQVSLAFEPFTGRLLYYSRPAV